MCSIEVCVACGLMTPCITWLCVCTERFGNRDYVLTLNYVTLDDDAEYTVIAKNIAGETKCSAQLIVEPETSEFGREFQDIMAPQLI